jgi:hypothetical protein
VRRSLGSCLVQIHRRPIGCITTAPSAPLEAEVSTSCFLGGATLADLSCVLVVRRASEGQSFRETSNPHEWIIDCAAPLELVWLEDLLIEVLRWDGLAWVLVAEWDGYEMTVHQ